MSVRSLISAPTARRVGLGAALVAFAFGRAAAAAPAAGEDGRFAALICGPGGASRTILIDYSKESPAPVQGGDGPCHGAACGRQDRLVMTAERAR